MTGAWINNAFVGVSKDDQSGYPTLVLISIILAPIGFILVFLIPLKRDLDETALRREREEIEEIKESFKRREERYRKRLQNRKNK